MDSNQREMVFQTSLRGLIDGSPQGGNRRILARAAGVSEATISHYLSGRIRPSFETLLRIAEYFNVSLDFLVYGERSQPQTPDDSSGVRAQIHRAMVEAGEMSGRHLDMVTRISRRLQAAIDGTARELAADGAMWGAAGFITNAEGIGLEACSLRVRAMTRHFHSDIHDDGGPGEFFEVVLANLRAGRRYQYLLYGDRDDWEPQVRAFRDLVADSGVLGDVVRENLRFHCIQKELMSAVTLLDLDLPLVERREPILWERYRDQVSPEGTWGYLGIGRSEAQGGVPFDKRYLESTLRQFHRDWAEAKPI